VIKFSTTAKQVPQTYQTLIKYLKLPKHIAGTLLTCRLLL